MLVETGARAAFDRDGVVAVRGVLDDGWIERLRAAVADVVGSAADLSAMAGTGGDGEGRAGRFRAGVDHWRAHPTFRAFATESPLPEIVATLLGSDEIVLYEDSLLVKEPGTAEATVWHQDLGYFHLEGEMIATTWCPLDPVDESTGAVRYLSGSHRWGRLFRPNLFVTDEAIPGTEGEPVPEIDDASVVSFASEPGDVVIHHAATLHGAGPNQSATTPRRAVSVRYAGSDAAVRLRPGAPRKAEQAQWRDGERLVDRADADFPLVWPARR